MKKNEEKAVHAVISLHGIRTRGTWQKDIAPELALVGLIPYGLDYGYFNIFQLLRRSNLDKQVNWLAKEYDRIRYESGCERPSVIAHSFGTLQIAYLLEKYEYVLFDQVILIAGIVPLAYPWSDMLNSQRVSWVVNNFSGKDIFPELAKKCLPSSYVGNSGSAKFDDNHRALHQVDHPYHGHSDYFSQGNFRRNWVPTLLLNKRVIVDGIHTIINIIAKQAGLETDRLRGFFLMVQSETKCLKVVPGAHLGEVSQREASLAIPLNAIADARVVAFNKMKEVRQSTDDIKALRASLGSSDPLHKDVKWSISLPVPHGLDYLNAGGVLIIDGLIELPDMVLEDELLQDHIVFDILIQIGAIVNNARLYSDI